MGFLTKSYNYVCGFVPSPVSRVVRALRKELSPVKHPYIFYGANLLVNSFLSNFISALIVLDEHNTNEHDEVDENNIIYASIVGFVAILPDAIYPGYEILRNLKKIKQQQQPKHVSDVDAFTASTGVVAYNPSCWQQIKSGVQFCTESRPAKILVWGAATAYPYLDFALSMVAIKQAVNAGDIKWDGFSIPEIVGIHTVINLAFLGIVNFHEIMSNHSHDCDESDDEDDVTKWPKWLVESLRVAIAEVGARAHTLSGLLSFLLSLPAKPQAIILQAFLASAMHPLMRTGVISATVMSLLLPYISDFVVARNFEGDFIDQQLNKRLENPGEYNRNLPCEARLVFWLLNIDSKYGKEYAQYAVLKKTTWIVSALHAFNYGFGALYFPHNRLAKLSTPGFDALRWITFATSWILAYQATNCGDRLHADQELTERMLDLSSQARRIDSSASSDEELFNPPRSSTFKKFVDTCCCCQSNNPSSEAVPQDVPITMGLYPADPVNEPLITVRITIGFGCTLFSVREDDGFQASESNQPSRRSSIVNGAYGALGFTKKDRRQRSATESDGSEDEKKGLSQSAPVGGFHGTYEDEEADLSVSSDHQSQTP